MYISRWIGIGRIFFYLFFSLYALKHPWKIKCFSKSSTAMWPNTRKFHAVTFVSIANSICELLLYSECFVSTSLSLFHHFFFIFSFALLSLVWLFVCREWNDYMPLSFILSLFSNIQWQLCFRADKKITGIFIIPVMWEIESHKFQIQIVFIVKRNFLAQIIMKHACNNFKSAFSSIHE